MPAMADRRSLRAELQEQWDSLDDLTARLSQRVRERPNRDAEDGPGHLPDPNVAQELILTRGRLAAVEKERDRLRRRLEATREKLRMVRTELRRDRRQLERLGAVLMPSHPAKPAAPAVTPQRPEPRIDAAPHHAGLHVVHEEPEPEFEGAPLPEGGLEVETPERFDAPIAAVMEPPTTAEPAPVAEEVRLAAELSELSAAVSQLDDVATVLTAAEAELSRAAADPGAPVRPAEAEAQAGADQPPPAHAVHWSARALFDRISARWRGRDPG